MALNSLSVGIESTLIGSTSVLASRKASKSSVNEHSSVVQTRVNARGKNASEHVLPPSFDSVTSVPEVDGRVKSGAGEPDRRQRAGRRRRDHFFTALSKRRPTSVQFTTFHQAVT